MGIFYKVATFFRRILNGSTSFVSRDLSTYLNGSNQRLSLNHLVCKNYINIFWWNDCDRKSTFFWTTLILFTFWIEKCVYFTPSLEKSFLIFCKRKCERNNILSFASRESQKRRRVDFFSSFFLLILFHRIISPDRFTCSKRYFWNYSNPSDILF